MTPHDDHCNAHFPGLTGNHFSEIRPASDNKSTILRLKLLTLCQFAKVLARVSLQQTVKIEPPPVGG